MALPEDPAAAIGEDWVTSHFDNPVYAKAACEMLANAHSGWRFSRGEDRLWRARRETWPDDVPGLASPTAGELDKLVSAIGDDIEGGQG